MGDEHRANEHGFRDKLGVRYFGQLLPQRSWQVNRYGAAGWLLVLHADTYVRALRALQALFSLFPKKRLNPTANRHVIRDVRWVIAARRRLSCQVQGEPETCLSPRSRAFSFTSRLRTNGGKKDGRRRTVGAEPTEKVGFGFPSISTKSWATSSARL